MPNVLRFFKNLLLLNSRLETDKDRQAKEGYSLELSNIGPETYITYSEKGRKIDVLADFTLLNDVFLHTDSLRKWSKPSGEELTPIDFEKVLDRVTRYLSCWGEVTLSDNKLPDNEDLKRSLTEQGIEFVETDEGLIHYSVDADVYREQIKKGRLRELPKADRDNTAVILNERRRLSEPLTPDEARRKMAAMTRRSFIIGGGGAVFGVLGWRWMSDETKYALLRRTFEFNERVAQTFYSPSRLAKEFPPGQLTAARVNGDIGMASDLDPMEWKLRVGGLAKSQSDLMLSLNDIMKLPRTDMIIEFKCIEGWSTITHFAGVRFSDFAARYAPDNKLPYVSLVTPDEGYYVGWDTAAIMHPQTLLAYEMNGRPLTPEHGAPLRLASPTKYGIKQIKRIGRIEFTGERPRDYWAEQGYDWYSGL